MTEEEKLDLIARKVSDFETKYGVDSGAYKKAIEAANSIEAINAIDAQSFASQASENAKDDAAKNEEQKEDASYQGKNLFYKLERKEDGSLVAIGNNGKEISGKNFEEINDSVLKEMKNHALSEKRESIVRFHSPDPDKAKIFAKAAILKYGITVDGDSAMPKDPEFWNDLKKQYMSDSKHKLADWVKLTRYIPDDLLSRSKEEVQIKEGMLKLSQIKSLRQGINPNLSPRVEQKPVKPQSMSEISLEQLKKQSELSM